MTIINLGGGSDPNMPPPELPPGVGDPGPRIVNSFHHAVALYYINTKRVIIIGTSFQDIRKAIAGLEIKVERYRMGLGDGVVTGDQHSGRSEQSDGADAE